MPNKPTDGESPESGQDESPSTGSRRQTRKKTPAKTATRKTTKKAAEKTAKKTTRKATAKKATRKKAGTAAKTSDTDEAEKERPKRRPAARKRRTAEKPSPPLELEEFSVAEEMFDLDDEFEPAEDAPVDSGNDAPGVTKLEAVESIEDALEELQAEAEALGDGLDDDDGDDEPEEEIEIPTGPVFEGEVPLETRDQRLDAMRKAALRLGIRRLHPEQEEVIEQGLGGKDVMMILPTGFGKSACYQIPSMILSKPVVVISPLLALMQDQYDKMEKLGVPCVRLDGTIRGGKRKEALERIRSGERLLVMTTPETLGAPDASEALIASGVSLAAVDEAHCISEWGYDFRPAYLQIGERLRAMGAPPVIALTATATEKVRMAIIRFVGMRDPHVVATSPHRSNLAFDVLHCAGGARLRALARLALRVRRPGIIYCSTTREVDEIWAVLKRFGVPVHRYHGKMTQADRRKSQNSFMQRGRRTVMIATNAFGLGIDKSDIRYVLHYQSPASLEQYVQEAGRAGRDGRRANCILLFSSEDRAIHESLLARSRVRPEQLYKLARALAAWALEEKIPSLQALALSAELGSRTTGALLALMEEATLVKWDQDAVYVIVPPEEFEAKARELAGQFETLRTQDARRLDAVADYAIDAECRATFLREYFGEEGEEPCGMCDRCRGQADRPDSFWEPLAPPKGEERRRRGRGNGRSTGKTGGRRRGQKQGRGRRRPASAKASSKQKAGNSAGRRRSEASGDARAAADGDARGSRKRRRRGSRGRRRRGRGQRNPEGNDQGDPPSSSPPPS
ncbi:MAG: ATP-dependent DNA helicase RecQ [bacterium]|nr:ATP-dependent DNA helicase RecQ [bacterium]MCP5069904.1 ATP-dependent DNA helicase RecQ [bacterium]